MLVLERKDELPNQVYNYYATLMELDLIEKCVYLTKTTDSESGGYSLEVFYFVIFSRTTDIWSRSESGGWEYRVIHNNDLPEELQ